MSSTILRLAVLALFNLTLVSSMGFIARRQQPKAHGDWPEDFPAWPKGFTMGCSCHCPSSRPSKPTKPTTHAATTTTTAAAPTTTPVPSTHAPTTTHEPSTAKPDVTSKPEVPSTPTTKLEPTTTENAPPAPQQDAVIGGEGGSGGIGGGGGIEGNGGSETTFWIRPPSTPSAPRGVDEDPFASMRKTKQSEATNGGSGNKVEAAKVVVITPLKSNDDASFIPSPQIGPIGGGVSFAIGDPRNAKAPKKTIDPDA